MSGSLDLAPVDGSDPVANHQTVERELSLHDPRLAALPRILALSKADLVEPQVAEERRAEWMRSLGQDVPVIVTSAVTRVGLDELGSAVMNLIPVHRQRGAHRAGGEAGEGAGYEAGDGEIERDGALRPGLARGAKELAERRVFRPAAGRAYTVERIGERSFRVSGAGVERLVARYDLANDEALAHLERRLRGIGVIRALEAQGFEPGDDVEIAGVEFELDPDL